MNRISTLGASLTRSCGRIVNAGLRRCGYELKRLRPLLPPDGGLIASPYQENPEAGASNLQVKLDRARKGGVFEFPNIVALNKTVASLIGDAKSIVELGGGTGLFAYEAAADPSVMVTCSEFDKEASEWAVNHRRRPNIRYTADALSAEDGPFDLVVSVEVIEHLEDYPGFIGACCALAQRALISTPNRYRVGEAVHAGPPAFYQHVREWSAGEFYWVLRAFYRQVILYGTTGTDQSGAVRVDVNSRMSPLIADCRGPLRAGSAR